MAEENNLENQIDTYLGYVLLWHLNNFSADGIDIDSEADTW